MIRLTHFFCHEMSLLCQHFKNMKILLILLIILDLFVQCGEETNIASEREREREKEVVGTL